MKTAGILTALILFCLPNVQAELISGAGVKAGVVVAKQDFDYANELSHDTKSRTGFDLGVYLEWFDFPNFSLLTEVHYVQKGMTDEMVRTDEFGRETGIITWSNRVDYLSIPVMAKVDLGTRPLSPYFVAGPRFDLFLGYASKLHESVYEDFNRFHLGGDVGVGVETCTAPVRMILELRYSPDIGDAFDNGFLRVKNNSYEILIGLKL